MIDFIWNLCSFVLALGILVAVHEWGHFWVARRCGVKVHRFSIGFGKPLWRKVDKHGTEFVIAAIPLGGYVKMLDERVDDVPPELAEQSFNNKPVLQRIAIIAAGPGVNFLFAIFAIWLLLLIGENVRKPIVGEIAEGSFFAQTNLKSGDELLSVGDNKITDWSSVNLELVSHMGHDKMDILYRPKDSVAQLRTSIDLSTWQFDPDEQSVFASLGLQPFSPSISTVLAVIEENTPAADGGLVINDKIVRIDGTNISLWQQIVDYVAPRAGQQVEVEVIREGHSHTLTVLLGTHPDIKKPTGYIGVRPFAEPWPEGYVFLQQHGPIDSAIEGAKRTWRLMVLSVEMLGKLVTGEVSVKNLSGPISIAQGAGNSAEYGIVAFLSFLALISVNLGIINLLPLPVLDGGHLLYYVIELITGKPVPERIQEIGFSIGGVVLLLLMSVAIFNDIARL